MLRKILVGVFVAGAAMAATAPAASAATTADTASFRMTVQYNGQATDYGTLKCNPATGDHRSAATACGQLSAVGGDFAALNVNPDRMCSMQYDPVTVTARGYWNGRYKSFSRTYGNPCVFANTTGSVFAI
ncbi:Protease inhibitor, SSI family (subtilisin inhibitor) [Alloactinosynnema sp. L-07]|uniref:SSI family serine proteinase inhibitor n=1 Tax=Alloactinosynnema sp. L-07 TaxID=1653480 RepID=UPI00065EFA2B|nr:SSI family serine proteinase inhibitor [Alloactinosynnema sp. L-07]CRK61251.1 Protease inhibitor, SSI family (subtilisin inhibitor) [Alloactinosynnema sp. L-07]